MFKKLSRSLYLFVFMFFLAGNICLLINFKGGQAGAEMTQPSANETSVTKPTALWASTLSGELDIETESIYGHTDVKVIESIEALAQVAYDVNHGVDNSATATYFLRVENKVLDLSGAFWTPIGTKENPFKGIFYGNGCEISNLTIDEISCESGFAGLFGCTDGATITDIRITGGFQIYGSNYEGVGSLAGSIVKTSIINCYDECSSRSGNTTLDISKSISKAENSYIYRGGSYDGITATYTTKDDIDNTITVGEATLAINGYVGFINAGEGEFRIGNAKWYEEKVARVLYDSSFSETQNCDANLYLDKNPKYRADAGLNEVYIINPGKKAETLTVTNSDEGTGFIENVEYDANAKISVTLDYNYGTRKPTLEFPYDWSFKEYFDVNSSYKTRAGYEYKILKNDEGNSVDVDAQTIGVEGYDYKNSYPKAVGTYTFEWTWVNTERNFNVVFAYASDEGGKIAGADFDIPTANLVNGTTNLTENFTSNAFGEGSDSYTFGLTIKPGYRISAISGTNEKTSIGNHKSDQKSGAYVNFDISTGEGSSYISTGVNNDFYNPVFISGTWNNEEIYNTNRLAGINGNKEYTFTVENVIGTGGTIVMVIERDWIDIDLTPRDVFGDGVTYDLSIIDNKLSKLIIDQTGEARPEDNEGILSQTGVELKDDGVDNSRKVVLYVRYQEGATVNFSVKSGSLYIVNYSTINENLNEGGNTLGNDGYAISKAIGGETPTLENYYKNWKIDFTNIHSYNSIFKTFLGSLQTNIAVEIYKEGESEIFNDESALSGVAVFVNAGNDTPDEGGVLNTTLKTISVGGTDSVRISKSGRYQAIRVEVIDNKTNISTPIPISSGDKYASDGNSGGGYAESYYYTGWYSVIQGEIFKILRSNSSEPNYTVKVYLAERTYDVKVEYYVGSTKITEENYEKLFTKLYWGSDDITLGANLTKDIDINYQLSRIGLGAIENSYYEVYQDGHVLKDKNNVYTKYYQNSDTGLAFKRAGYETMQLTIDSPSPQKHPSSAGEYDLNLTMGSYDTTVKIYFAYRKVDIQVEKVHLLTDGMEFSGTDHLVIYKIEDLTFSFEDSVLKLVSDQTKGVGNIQIHSQYYLLGWYLRNGVTVTTAYEDFLTDSNFVDAIAEASSANESKVTFVGMQALVEKRTVSVTYNAGEEGKGQLYKNTNEHLDYDHATPTLVATEADKKMLVKEDLTYGEDFIVSLFAYFNLGHNFNGYNPTFGLMKGNIESGEYIYSISGEQWYNLLRQVNLIQTTPEGGYQVWAGFATTDNDKKSAVELTALWEIIKYNVLIDGSRTATFSIKDNIFYTTIKEDKNGLATYNIGQDSANRGINGEAIQGYVVTGFSMSQGRLDEGSEAIVNYLEVTGESKSKTIDATEFLKFIQNKYRFEVNPENQPIKINTLRTEANYLLQLVGSRDNYYSYEVTDEFTSGGYGIIESGNVYYVNVTFNFVPSLLTEAINKGALKVTREGYTLIGWTRANDSGEQTSRIFSTEEKYLTTSDTKIVPIWEKSANTTQGRFAFNEDSSSVNTYYLFNSHNIAKGYIEGNNVSSENSIPKVNQTLLNGEKITGFQIIVYYEGRELKRLDNLVNFNIDQLLLPGSYSIVFKIDVEDMISKYDADGQATKITYSTSDNVLEFSMSKNTLYFFNNHFATIYNGTSEFVEYLYNNAGEVVYHANNEYGQVVYQYDWNGTDRSTFTKQQLEALDNLNNTFEKFDGYQIASEDVNAGAGKNLKMKIIRGTLGEYDFDQMLSNIDKIGEDYYVTLNGVLTIEKAPFTISFDVGSAYYFEGETITVYLNSATHYFEVGNQDFSYNYSKITLHPNATTPMAYVGQLDHAKDSQNFVISDDLTINGTITGDELAKNFEWNISKESVFNLLDPEKALPFNYSLGYLMAIGGSLSSDLATRYNGIIDKINITGITVTNNATGQVTNIADPTLEQGNVYVDNIIFFTYLGNGTGSLKLLINTEPLSGDYTLSYNVNISIDDATRANKLRLLSYVKSGTSIETLSSYFDEWTPGGYSLTVNPKEAESGDYMGVLTDVVKITVDYNTGSNASGIESEVIYTSVYNSEHEGKISLKNPNHTESKYLKFNGYKTQNNSNLVLENDSENGAYFISNAIPGRAETITAKWQFYDFDFNIKEGKESITKKANINALKLLLDEFMTLNVPNGVTGRTLVMVGSKTPLVRFEFSEGDLAFIIKDSAGHASFDLSDTYTITVSYTYSDNNASQPQTVTKELTISLSIERNTITLEVANGENLTFNNREQNGNVTLKVTDENGERNVILTDIANIPDSGKSHHFYATVRDTNENVVTFKDVASYVIKAQIDPSLAGVYQFGTDDNNAIYTVNLPVKISKYIIELASFQTNFDLFKYFGQTETPIKAKVTIADNLNDEIEVTFTRESGEAIANYSITDAKIENAYQNSNYELSLEGFTTEFRILVPKVNMQVEFDKDITYVYNGQAASDYKVIYDSANAKYVLTITAGEKYSTTFDLYYLDGQEKVYIPENERDNYTQFITFTSNSQPVVGSYTISVSLSQLAQNANWSGVSIVNEGGVKLVVTKRTLTVTEINKVYDGTDNLYYNTLLSGNNCVMVLEGVVAYTDSATLDEIEIKGSFTNKHVGTRDIVGILSLGDAGRSGCYQLEYADTLKVTITPDTINQVDQKTTTKNLPYGRVTDKITKEELESLFNFAYSYKEGGSAIDTACFTVDKIEINDASYSKGKYLNVDTYTIVVTVSSRDFTFTNGIETAGLFSTTFEHTLTIEKKAITITNSTRPITKRYDGNVNLTSPYLDKLVDEINGYYTSNGILAGDKVRVVSGIFTKDSLIEQNKNIALTFADDDDHENYEITQNVVGNILSTPIYFNKVAKPADFTFVNDGKDEFKNTEQLELSYNGNVDELIQDILNSKYLERVGYTCLGYTFNNNGEKVEISLAMTAQQKADFLQKAVDAGSVGLDIDAIWQRNEYTVTFDIQNADVYNSRDEKITSVTLPYYNDSTDGAIDFKVIAHEGYKITSYTLSSNVIEAEGANLNTKTATLTLTHISDNLTIEIRPEEIEVKIIISYNQPAPDFNGDYIVSTTSAGWNASTRTLSYSALKETLLPELTLDRGYSFDYWTMAELENRLDNTRNLWTLINGASLTTDNTSEGVSFVAHWKELEIELSFALTQTNVTVYDNGSEIEPSEGKYTVLFGHDITIEIATNPYYKWTGVSVSAENYLRIEGNSANSTNSGNIVIYSIQNNIDITLTSTPMKFSFSTAFTTPVGTTIAEQSGDISGEYDITQGELTLADILGAPYTPSVGTYSQDGWTYSTLPTFTPDAKVTDVIKAICGGLLPTQERYGDNGILLKAFFKGYTYTITFDKTSEANKYGADFMGTDAGIDPVTRDWEYGKIINNIPTLSGEKEYVWHISNGLEGEERIIETFENGQYFITPNFANDSHTLTLTAAWGLAQDFTMEIVGKREMVEDINGNEIASPWTISLVYYNGANKAFNFNLNTGYEIGDITGFETGDEYSLNDERNSLTIKHLAENRTIHVEIRAKTYNVTFVESTENYYIITGKFNSITFDEANIADKFNALRFIRDGYLLEKLTFNGEDFAIFGESGFNFVNDYVISDIYKYDGDITLLPVWKVKEGATYDYLKAVSTAQSGLIYNGDNQAIVNVVITEKNAAFTGGKNDILNNGEQITDIYYKLNGVRYEIDATSMALMYKNYLSGGQVELYIDLKDTLSGGVHTIVSNSVVANIAKADLVIAGAKLETYFTGTNKYLPTSENESVNTLGSVTFVGGKANAELTISHIELIDPTGKYYAGGDYIVKYYFTSSSSFDITNYNNLTSEGGFITFVTDESVKANVVKAQIKISFNEKGFFKNSVHKVSEFTIEEVLGGGANFTINVSSITTKQSAAAIYNKTGDFEIVWNVIDTTETDASQQDKTANFEFVATGTFEIVSSEFAYTVEIGARYFDIEKLSVNSANIVRIAYFDFRNKQVEIGNGDFNYSVGGELVLTVVGNGTDNPYVQVSKGSTVKFGLEINGSMAVLTWTKLGDENVIESLTSLLNQLSIEGDREWEVSVSGQTTAVAVITDFKAARLHLGDLKSLSGTEDIGFSYVRLGANVTLPNPEAEGKLGDIKGFAFANWEVATEGLSVNELTLSAEATAKIIATSVSAQWTLETPKGNAEDQKFKAKVDINGTKDITLSDLLTGGDITNRHELISYSYSLTKAGSEITTIDMTSGTITLPTNTTSDGEYLLTITAKRAGYTPISLELTFNVKVDRLALSSIELSKTEFVYLNEDFVPSIRVTFAGEGIEGTEELSTLLSRENSSYSFTLSGMSESEIKLAGNYSLKFVADQTIFDLDGQGLVKEFDIMVAQATVEINLSDIPEEKLSKLFGNVDPEFTFTKDMFEGESLVTVTLTLEREAGENIGEYAFTSGTTQNANFIIEVKEDAIFTIEKSNFELIVTFDNSLSMVYSKTAPNFELAYDKLAGKWVVTLGSTSSTLTLSYLDNGEEVVLTGSLNELALKNVNFSAPEAIIVGTYTQSDIIIGGNGNFSSFKLEANFTITKRVIEYSSINKSFNRNDEIAPFDTKFTNVIEGDEVILTGRYAQITVGDNIRLLDVALTGSASDNYSLPDRELVGRITPRDVANVTFTITNLTYEYGQVMENLTLSDLLLLAGNYALTIDGITDDIASGYVTIDGFAFAESDISGAGALKAGNERTIIFYIKSANFAGLREDGYSIKVRVLEKEIDLSSLTIIRRFIEGNRALPANLSDNIDNFILKGDDARIDLNKGGYSDDQVGYNKDVIIELTGVDHENYTVKRNIKGSITAYVINFNVVEETAHADLVTGGNFVADGLHPVVTNRTFTVGYPAEFGNQEIIDTLKAPTRKGYSFNGWKVASEGGYTSLTIDNIIEVLKNAVESAEDLDNITLNIYASWEIDRYLVKLSGNNIAQISVTSNDIGDVEEKDGIYYLDYFSSIEITFVCDRGFKIRSYNLIKGESADRNLNDTKKNKGTISFSNIASDIELNIVTEEIKITFNVNVNLPQFTTRVDSNSLVPEFKYSTLATLSEHDLPVLLVENGTYYLSHYTYNGNQTFDEKTLKEVVDELYEDLDGDKIISVRANWEGEDYVVFFNPTEGVIEGENEVNVKFGERITSFPVATLAGRTPVWMLGDKEYVEGDRLSNKGTFDEERNCFLITLSASWQNAPFDITITFDSRLTVNVNGRNITSGATFTLVYSEDDLQVIVLPAKGYTYSIDSDGVNGEITDNSSYIMVKNLVANSQLHFNCLPGDNILRLFNTNVDNFFVTINGQQSSSDFVLTVKTEESVQITYSAVKGYEFNQSSVTFRGSGKYTTTISEDGKVLTVIWSDFVEDATISVEAVASINEITIADVRELFVRLSLNNTPINLTGDTYRIKTGEKILVQGVMAYGYTGGNLSTGENNYVVEGSVTNTFNTTDNYYYFTATIEGFDEDFEIIFSGRSRSFNFAISIAEGDEAYGELTCQSEQTIEFGSELTLSQRELLETYEFVGWMIGDKVISTEGNTNYKITSLIKDALEVAGEEGTVYITAHYARKVRDITLTTTGKGTFTITQQGSETITVNGQTIGRFFLGIDAQVKISPNPGYELNYILLSGKRINLEDYGFDNNTMTLTVEFDLFNPIESIEVVFIPSEIKVIVQAGTVINFIDNLGTSAGGKIFATDSQGNRLSDEAYLAYEGKVIIGANYRLLSHTDDILYFEIEAKDGFLPSIVTSVGIVTNEITIGERKIYQMMGATEGSIIKVLFTAKENTIKVIFANEGDDTKAVHGGIFEVDDSEGYISASPKRGDNMNVYIVTGTDLHIDINSLISYTLLTDEDGNLKYKVISDETIENVTVGKVEDRDPTTTGFNNGSYLSMKEVSTSATVIIYVKPIEYSLRFVVDESTSIVLDKKITYGEEWSVDDITQAEKAIIFATRKDFTFTGYFYNSEKDKSVQYIDRYGDVVLPWQNMGYTNNGSIYKQDDNYDATTHTFTLYAGWSYNKASIRIEVLPVNAVESRANSIYAYISNLTSIVPAPWVGQDDLMYTEVPVGSSLNFSAPIIEGFTFAGFTLQFEGGEITDRGVSFTLDSVEMGDYIVRAKYNPNFSITIKNENNDFANGGESFIRQDNGIINGSFNPEKYITLVALPKEGYNFLYWINNDTEEIYYGQPGVGGEIVYTFNRLLDSQLNLTAVFAGKEIKVNFNIEELGKLHTINSMILNGQVIDITKEFTAYVGDTFVVKVTRERGYGFDSSIFKMTQEPNGQYVFTYTFDVKDLAEGESGYKISLDIPVSREDITFVFNTFLEGVTDKNEINKSASLYFVDSTGSSTIIENGQSKVVKYGDNFTLRIVANQNYRYEETFLLFNSDFDGIEIPKKLNISSLVNNGLLIINKEFVDTYFEYLLNINVYFSRSVWTDEDVTGLDLTEEIIDGVLSGEGSHDSPYIIQSARDFAIVASLVNKGKLNGLGRKYSQCSYKVTNDINFEGYFWEPIGTEENPFEGEMDLGKFEYKNVIHYRTYSNPRASHYGLFWHVSKDAKITKNTKTVVIIVVVICLVILIIILIILLILWLNRRKKKKLDQLANQ